MTSAAAATAATPLAPFLHFATTVGARRAEEERRLAARFGDTVLDIEVGKAFRSMDSIGPSQSIGHLTQPLR
jgi:hypothetical protein